MFISIETKIKYQSPVARGRVITLQVPCHEPIVAVVAVWQFLRSVTSGCHPQLGQVYRFIYRCIHLYIAKYKIHTYIDIQVCMYVYR